MGEIVLAYKPSNKFSDWICRADGEGNWFYEQFAVFYCTGCKQLSSGCAGRIDGHRRTKPDTYYDLEAKQETKPPIVYITHCPTGEEWRPFKTIDDVRKSKLYVRG